MAVTEDAAAIAGELAHLRRAIHAEPETGLHLPLTQEKILAALDGLPLEVTRGSALTSVTAVLRGGAVGGPVVLLRADMDALPVTERTGLGYASTIDGTMHACGHDLHSAMLAGAARLLSARQADLPGSVVFMFQPGEEGHGGARFMIEEGVLEAAGERPAAAYALHVASAELPAGVFSSREGTMMAAAEALNVTVHGRGGHGSEPHHAADPIPVACEIVTALQVLVTRTFDIADPVVITVGSFHAGTTNNVIPDEARLQLTIRSFSPAARTRVRDASPAWCTTPPRRMGSPPPRSSRTPTRSPSMMTRRHGSPPRWWRTCSVRIDTAPRPTRWPGRRTSRSSSKRCPARSSCWARARRPWTPPRRRSTTRRSPCSTTWCWPTAQPYSPN